MLPRAHAALIGALLLASACDGGEPPPPCDLCAAPSDTLSAASGRAYLVSRVIFRPAVGGVGDGVDVDATITDRSTRVESCVDRVRDLVSRADSRVTGVDNAGQALIDYGEQAVMDGRTFQGELDAAVAEGRIRWAIEVGEPAPLDAIRWEVPIAFHTIDADATIEIAAGVPVSGQTLRSAEAGRTSAVVTGDGARGLFDAPVEGVWVNEPDVLLLPMDDLSLLGIAIDTDEGAPTAEVGGRVTVDGLVDLFAETFMSSPGDADLARRVFEAVADLDPDPSAPNTCRAVSVGFRLELVPVTL